MLNGSPEMGGLVIRVPRAAIRAKKDPTPANTIQLTENIQKEIFLSSDLTGVLATAAG
jgi:hypothetical protein